MAPLVIACWRVNLALFHSTLPEPGRKVGGVEVFVHRLARRLAERGHGVTVLTFGSSPANAPFRVASVGPRWLAEKRLARLTLAPLILNRLSGARFDVLHLHGDDWFFVRRGLPTVRTFYGSALFEARTATNFGRRAAQGLVYPLETLASRLATSSYDIGTPLAPGYRVHGSLSLAVDRAVEDRGLRSSVPTVLFVGTWLGRKRGAFLAEQFIQNVRPRHPTAELLMVSDTCVESPGIRWVRFPSDEELQALYARAWVFCSPSTYEGFGLPYLEAMQRGLPVVGTPNVGARHVLGEAGGRLVPDAELGSAVAELLGNPDERTRLAASGRRRAQMFTWERVVDQHEKAYELAIVDHARRT